MTGAMISFSETERLDAIYVQHLVEHIGRVCTMDNCETFFLLSLALRLQGAPFIPMRTLLFLISGKNFSGE